MQINDIEITKEKKILNSVNKLLNNNILALKEEVHVSSDNLIEFKKLSWSDFSSFDSFITAFKLGSKSFQLLFFLCFIHV